MLKNSGLTVEELNLLHTARKISLVAGGTNISR